MKKIKKLLKYIFSIFNPMWRDTWLHFFIKSTLAIIIGFILSIIITDIISLVSYLIKWEEFIFLNIALSIAVSFTVIFILQIFVASRRLRDLWRSQWTLILYFISHLLFPLWLLYWLYFCFGKSVDNIDLVKKA